MTLEEIKKLDKKDLLKKLTIKEAKKLKGKKIATLYYGYAGQDGVDNFIVGEVKKEVYPSGKLGEKTLFTQDGRNTYITAYDFNKGSFTCSDSDRFVLYTEI